MSYKQSLIIKKKGFLDFLTFINKRKFLKIINLYRTFLYCGSQELIETTSIGKGFALLNNDDLYLRKCSLINFRFGGFNCEYSRVHKSSDSFFSKILEKPLIHFLGNKKLSLNQNVWRDHATMQQDVLLHFWVIFLYQNQAEI